MESALVKYRAFLTAARLGSFTRAAEALGYSQSGISRMIADLEREWGVRLLERDRGGVRLTSEGHELAPAVQAVCDEHGRLQARIDSMSGLESGLIRIGTVTSVATHWLPNIVRRYREDYPNIDYEITTRGYSEVERMIAEGQVDCGFVRLP
ncbi:MAG: LysR family transcriptional regulator, partial [Eggerthellaceae bacterium]|nr:LysR family transcriptional regulator [Eggerthellaceae bacterium]